MALEARDLSKPVKMWDPYVEAMPRGELARLQLERLQNIVEYAYNNIPFYRRHYDQHGVKPGDVKRLEDIHKLPFITKQDLRDQYPFGMFAVPMEKVVRIHASSGTTGKPVVGGYTRNDLDLWSEMMARTLTSAGVTHRDVVQNAYGHGLFTGGLGFHMGAERIGSTVIPISGGLTKRQLMLMEDFGTTVLTCTPSYALVIAEEAEESGIDLKSRMKLRVGVFGAEPWTEEMRQEVEEKMGIEAYDIYGLTEIIGPGVAVECPYHQGLHVFEDHFFPEIIDPDSGEPLPSGTKGELVFTTLTKEAFPAIRFRTRDRTVLNHEPCRCGRTLARMKKVTGRTDDMLIIRGVNVFPSQIEEILLRHREVEPQYQIIVDRSQSRLDNMEVRVEASAATAAQGHAAMEELSKKIADEILQICGASAKVKVVAPHSIPRSEGKAKRVYDLREIDKG